MTLQQHPKQYRRDQVKAFFVKNAGDKIRAVLAFFRPFFDLILRIYFAKIFIFLGIRILSVDKTLSWAGPLLDTYWGVSIALVGGVLVLLGLLTRIAAVALLIMTIIVQIQFDYQPLLNTQTILILLLGWTVIFGAGKISLDQAFGGVKDSAIFLSKPISILYEETTRFVGPFYQLALRFWIACIAMTAGWVALQSGWSPYPVLGYRLSSSLLTAFHYHGYEMTLLMVGALIGLGAFTRLISLGGMISLVVVLCFFFPSVINVFQYDEAVAWIFLLGLLLFHGPGSVSIDHWIKKITQRWLHHRYVGGLAHKKSLPHVVIIGGGFGGVAAAKSLKTTACRITLIDQHNYHLFQPLLYQVATAGLSPAEIAAPIRSLFVDQPNIDIKLGEVVAIDSSNREIKLNNQDPVSYDYLILATGAQHSYFGQDQWSTFAPGLKKIEDAIAIRQKVLSSFEQAENLEDSSAIDAQTPLLTIVIVGGGPTGIELAGAFAELAHDGMHHEFRHIDPKKAQIILVEAGPRLLASMPEKLSEFSRKSLENLGVTVLLNTPVESIDQEGIIAKGQRFASKNVFWAAGVQGSKAAQWLNAPVDRAGRIEVNPDLSVPGFDNVFAIGDTISVKAWDNKLMPGIAPAAKQSGKYVAQLIQNHIEEKPPLKPFRYQHYGNLATIGRSLAVIDFGHFQMSGSLAWWFWCGIHLYFINNMRNRFQIMLQWFWSYLTFKKSSRIIYENNKT